jgi:hypothetical protein
MNRAETDFLHKSQETSSKFITAKSNFTKGMKWEENSINILPKERELINNSAADHLVRTVRYLQLPGIPEISLLFPWEITENKSNDSKGETIYANAYIDKDFPNGLIRISPVFIESFVIKSIREEGNWSILHLGALLAHESFHLWQYIHIPEKVERDLTIYGNLDLNIWNQTQTEREAKEFEKYWIENWFKH